MGLAAMTLASRASAGLLDRRALDTFVAAQMRAGAIPGLAIGIARAGRVLCTRGYGLADIADGRRVTTESMFHIASVTKTVTATGIMMLVEQGLIALDDPVNRHLDFAVANPAASGVPITVRQLLMHTSSLSDETYYKVDFRTPGQDASVPLDQFLKNYLVPGGAHYTAAGSYSAATPGQAYDYSNVGYGLLGYLGERVVGMDFRTYLDQHLFQRLDMKRPSWTIAGVPSHLRVVPYEPTDDGPRPVAAVGSPDWPGSMIRTSISGLMPFVAAAANGGVAGRTRMLGAAAMAQMLEMHAPAGLPSWLTGQGLAWMESPEAEARRINHWGGDPGVFTAAYLDPAATTGIAIFTNITATTASKAAIKALAGHLLHLAGSVA